MSGKRNCTDVEMPRGKEFSHSTKKWDGIVEVSELVSGDKDDYSIKLPL